MSTTETVETVVIGAGHAGLAVSRMLTDAGRDHVVIERGRVAERWRTERWDSVHLITPSWMLRLPGMPYAGSKPDSYLSGGGFVRHLEGYARSFCSPVVSRTTVLSVEHALGPGGSRYRVRTDRGTWLAVNVVVATGPYELPNVPSGLRPDVPVVTSSRYRNPESLPSGGVLVVGASASGAQIADELRRAGRDVTVAAGRHTRMPRRYRGVDAYFWMEQTGRLSRTIDSVADPVAARREPSPQLVGGSELERSVSDLDLGTLAACGVRVVGRLQSIDGPVARFRSDLQDKLAAADAALSRFLDDVDDHVERDGMVHHVWGADRPGPLVLPAAPERLDLRAEGIGAIVLATGQRPHFPWLRVPVVTEGGAIRQRRGVTPAPGLYVVGQRFQHRRDSASIDGARFGAADVVAHVVGSRPRILEPLAEEAVS
jgi:putative flavoprotein involved in K+ transport